MIETISRFLQTRKERTYRWFAKRRLIRRYEYLIQVNTILEEFITKKILDGGSSDFLGKMRSDLVAKQNEIKETQKMVDFLKGLK